jgi:hypothetical protein
MQPPSRFAGHVWEKIRLTRYYCSRLSMLGEKESNDQPAVNNEQAVYFPSKVKYRKIRYPLFPKQKQQCI